MVRPLLGMLASRSDVVRGSELRWWVGASGGMVAQEFAWTSPSALAGWRCWPDALDCRVVSAHPDQAVLASGFGAEHNAGETEAEARGWLLQSPVRNAQAIDDRTPDAMLHVYDGGHPFIAQDPPTWPDIGEFLTARVPHLTTMPTAPVLGTWSLNRRHRRMGWRGTYRPNWTDRSASGSGGP